MIGFDYGHGWSSTGWETSFYGGYDRTLYDMPDVKVDYDVRVNIPLKSKMSYYNGQKLLKTFLLRVKTLNLTDHLLHKSTIEERDTWGGFGKKKRVLVVSKQGIERALDYIINYETELKNLFEHYKNDIIESDIEFTLKDDEECKSKGKSTSDLVTDLLGKTAIMKPYKSFSSISGTGDVPDPVFIIQEQDRRESYLDEKQKLLAKQIVNKLDITFDPDRDDIHSLKQGKLDTRKLAEAVAHNDHIYYRTEEDQKTKPFSVVILCDESGSMRHDSRMDRQYNLVKVLYSAFSEIMPQDRISVYGHSGDEEPEIYVYQDKYNPGFMKTIDNMRGRDMRENYDGPVVESIHERIRSQSSDNVLFIVISDGQPSGDHGYGGSEAMTDLKRIVEKCKRDNFVTMGIGFGYSGVKELYAYHTVIHDLSETVEKVTTLLNKVVKTEFQ
jgi:hypothetical protein